MSEIFSALAVLILGITFINLVVLLYRILFRWEELKMLMTKDDPATKARRSAYNAWLAEAAKKGHKL